jgi:hypothetical protein
MMRSLILALILLLLAGCSAQQAPRTPAVALATDGPPLALVGEFDGMKLEGQMDRNCMAGYGKISLRYVGQADTDDLSVNVPDDMQASGVVASTSGGKKAVAPAVRQARRQAAGLSLASYPHDAPPVPEIQDNKAARQRLTGKKRPMPGRSPGSRLTLDDYKPHGAGSIALPEQRQISLAPAQTSNGTVQDSRGKESLPPIPLSVDTSFSCEASIDQPPTEKGRIRGVLYCSDNRTMLISLRNLGPDQGVGIGKESQGGELMVLFYHAGLEEARRRFPAVKADIVAARSRQ